MSALRLARVASIESSARVDVALLGTGVVGSAFLARLARLQGNGAARVLRLVQVANSRHGLRAADGDGIDLANARTRLTECDIPPSLASLQNNLGAHGLVIDATASEDVARWHPRWLESGLLVVTANKAGIGGDIARYRAIATHASRYGDAATVGAGLPLLRTLRELRAGGDAIQGFAGVLSGSLAWLFNHYDGMRPFSSFVREARVRGYTEPDPRLDLSGTDVKRKLLILARNAGFALESDDVEVESLLPEALVKAAAGDVDGALESLDAPLRECYQSAYRKVKKLRFVARLEAGRARIGLERLSPDDALAAGSGCDNRLAIHSDRYCENPLVIQGPGAGADVTAAALLDDALRLARR